MRSLEGSKQVQLGHIGRIKEICWATMNFRVLSVTDLGGLYHNHAHHFVTRYYNATAQIIIVSRIKLFVLYLI